MLGDEEQLTPVGIIDDGRKEEVLIDSGDVWTERGYHTYLKLIKN